MRLLQRLLFAAPASSCCCGRCLHRPAPHCPAHGQPTLVAVLDGTAGFSEPLATRMVTPVTFYHPPYAASLSPFPARLVSLCHGAWSFILHHLQYLSPTSIEIMALEICLQSISSSHRLKKKNFSSTQQTTEMGKSIQLQLDGMLIHYSSIVFLFCCFVKIF